MQTPSAVSNKFLFNTIMERGLEDESRSNVSKQFELRKDPHEEFFKLTLLAFKLNNKVSNTVLIVSPYDF